MEWARAADQLTAPGFMIVGTPRSGTTLVQRLASELPGVHVPPETHFFDTYIAGLMERRRFPLARAAIAEELREYLAIPTVRGLALDVGAVAEALGGRCDSPLELFSAIVANLADGAAVCGEKTPDHLRWWRPLTRSLPDLRLVAVVRDPRAVVASARKMPWSAHPPGILAEGWRLDAREVAALSAALPAERRLVLRYEDVVRRPDEARAAIARLIGVGAGGPADVDDGPMAPIFLPGEWWKEKVREPVTDRWVDHWRTELTEEEARDVELICHAEMRRFGYADPGEAAPPPLGPELEWQTEFWRTWLAKKLAEVAEYERRFGATPPDH